MGSISNLLVAKALNAVVFVKLMIEIVIKIAFILTQLSHENLQWLLLSITLIKVALFNTIKLFLKLH